MKIDFWNSCDLQPANSFTMLELSHFHDRVILVLIFIYPQSQVKFCLLFIIDLFLTLIDNYHLERMWIFTSLLFLWKIAVPSLSILCIMDGLVDCSLRIKVITHQWYWTYELADFYPKRISSSLEFDKCIWFKTKIYY